MTNREQVAWALSFSEYDDRTAAETVSEMLDAAGVAFLDSAERARLEKWMGLKCEPETNNWGVLEGNEE